LMGGLLHLVQRGGAWVGCGLAQAPNRCTKCNSSPINGQCSNINIIRCGTIITSIQNKGLITTKKTKNRIVVKKLARIG